MRLFMNTQLLWLNYLELRFSIAQTANNSETVQSIFNFPTFESLVPPIRYHTIAPIPKK
jgi:hypothetical protein